MIVRKRYANHHRDPTLTASLRAGCLRAAPAGHSLPQQPRRENQKTGHTTTNEPALLDRAVPHQTSRNVVTVAIARELAGFLWAEMTA